MEKLLRFQVDFERKYGTLDNLDKAEEKLANFILKKQEEMEMNKNLKSNYLKRGKIKNQNFLNKKRKFKEIQQDEEEGDYSEPELQKKVKIQKNTHTFKDSKFQFLIINFLIMTKEILFLSKISHWKCRKKN